MYMAFKSNMLDICGNLKNVNYMFYAFAGLETIYTIVLNNFIVKLC